MNSAPDDFVFHPEFWYFAFFSMKVYVMGIHYSYLSEALLMSTQSIYFLWRNQENVYLDIPIIWSYAE